jgi:hypothetical protein
MTDALAGTCPEMAAYPFKRKVTTSVQKVRDLKIEAFIEVV